MQRIVLTKSKKGIVCVDFRQMAMLRQSGEQEEQRKERPWNVAVLSEDAPSQIGKIVVGHVRDVVKNIEAAFVEIEQKELGYLSLKKGSPIFLNRKNTEKVCEGDTMIVQVEKDPIKTKDAVLTTQFSLRGRLVVLTHGKSGISVSAKIRDEHFRREMQSSLQLFGQENFGEYGYGIIVRTEAYKADIEELFAEWKELHEEYHRLIQLAMTRQKYYVLKEPQSQVEQFLQSNLDREDACEIVTDCPELYKEICQCTAVTKAGCNVRMYEDKLLPLYKLYSLESVFEDIYSQKVWLKSGAYLVIEYTEAMTVIDVNTGKCDRGKNKEKTFLNINLEAAWEIARQLRIRNVSGIIIVDFIDMEEEDTRKLLEYTRKIMALDPVKVNVVDMTRLHLMEITRKKTTDRIPYYKELF